jgi:hypothetical protein
MEAEELAVGAALEADQFFLLCSFSILRPVSTA